VATRTINVCDIGDTAHDAERTSTFAVDGATFEIDLCSEHLHAFAVALGEYADVARRPSNGHTTRSRSTVRTGPDPKAVRAWANERGISVSEKGRIPQPLMAQYLADR
jgi:hypothetical protein